MATTPSSLSSYSLLPNPCVTNNLTSGLSAKSASPKDRFFFCLQLVSDLKVPFLRGCKTCGREETEKGCNGEGRIQGGIATVPGFGWWPIKADRYRRKGQSMDEVVSGGGGRGASAGIDDKVQMRKKRSD